MTLRFIGLESLIMEDLFATRAKPVTNIPSIFCGSTNPTETPVVHCISNADTEDEKLVAETLSTMHLSPTIIPDELQQAINCGIDNSKPDITDDATQKIQDFM